MFLGCMNMSLIHLELPFGSSFCMFFLLFYNEKDVFFHIKCIKMKGGGCLCMLLDGALP